MKGVRWFQRMMLVVLIGGNAFLYLSMKGFKMGDRILYTSLVCLVGVVLISIFGYFLKIQKEKKKRLQES